MKKRKAKRDIFEVLGEFEAKNPGIVEAMELAGASVEKYEAALQASYRPRTTTSSSTEVLLAN